MSTATTPSSTTPMAKKEVPVYSHSSLFYWWPVWAFGLIAGVLSMFSGYYLVVFPGREGEAEGKRKWLVIKKEIPPLENEITLKKDDVETREGILLTEKASKADKHLAPYDSKNEVTKKESMEKPPEVRLHIAKGKGLGVAWAMVLLIVIFITNVPLRGMWSVMVITTIIFLTVLFWALDWWDAIFNAIRLLDIRINAGAYFFISLVLMGMWLFAFLFFDRQIYIIFQPGQMKVCLEIGAGEKTYDTMGMTIERQRSDLFRHWVLGLGSGDLIVRTSGADSHEFQLHNVLFLGRKLSLIEDMQRTKPN